MNIIRRESRLCLCCMEMHDVQIVEVMERNVYKGKTIEYKALYEYCERADEFLATEAMITENDLAMKNAYREQSNLLTSEEINEIRDKYAISQKDLARLLGWGEKTITRYEGHQIQDMAHDYVLRKIDNDPGWFLELLEIGREKISIAAYEKYRDKISEAYEKKQNDYLKKSICAQYAKYQNHPEYCGNSHLDFEKIVDVIRYFANSDQMTNLYKVKLMKLLWYADSISYKRYGHSITGLIYKVMPMGALPLAHKYLVDLRGICYEEVEFDNGTGYRFVKSDNLSFDSLSKGDKDVLDAVIKRFGNATKEQIVNAMHAEAAYKNTRPGDFIDYKYAKELMIQ